MSKIKLKVCGMKDPDNIKAVLGLKPELMGFIFYQGSPRFVGSAFAIRDSDESTKRVGVFVNEGTQEIMKEVRNHKLDFVQLHGAEAVVQCGELKEQGVGVIKAFSVDDYMNFGVTSDFHSVVDYFLFDTKGKYHGGNARRFNWQVLSRYDQKTPFFLSGGITPDHIDEIRLLQNYNLYAIDVNSGVESAAGYKDVEKIRSIQAKLNIKHLTS